MNVSIIIVLGLLLLLAAMAAIMLYKERKNNKDRCAGCPYRNGCDNDKCHKDDDTKAL